MTAFIPNTRVTVQRGYSAPNEYGDELPATTAVATGVPAAISEGRGSTAGQDTQLTYQPSGDRGGVVETFTIRLRPGTDVTEHDRLVDERTAAVYQVRAVYVPPNLSGLSDVRVIAVRTGAASEAVNA